MQEHGPGSRAAKVVVGLIGGLYLLSGLGLTAYQALLVLGIDKTADAGDTRLVLFAGAALAVWVLLTGIAAVVLALEAEEPATAWLGGLGLLALGIVVSGAFAIWFFTRP
jgi:hypothetical protein